MSEKSRALVSRGRGRLDTIYRRDRGICQFCYKKCKRADATRGHIIDVEYCKTREEANDLRNMQLEHTWCNQLKDKEKKEARKNAGQSLSYEIGQALGFGV